MVILEKQLRSYGETAMVIWRNSLGHMEKQLRSHMEI